MRGIWALRLQNAKTSLFRHKTSKGIGNLTKSFQVVKKRDLCSISDQKITLEEKSKM